MFSSNEERPQAIIHSNVIPFTSKKVSFFSAFRSDSSFVATSPDQLEQFSSRLYVCSVCQKTFNQKANLNVHFRIHTGERPFKCPVCQKGFSTKQNMMKHQFIHDFKT